MPISVPVFTAMTRRWDAQLGGPGHIAAVVLALWCVVSAGPAGCPAPAGGRDTFRHFVYRWSFANADLSATGRGSDQTVGRPARSGVPGHTATVVFIRCQLSVSYPPVAT